MEEPDDHPTPGQDPRASLFELFVRSVKDHALIVLDPQGRVASWNEGARRLGGYEAEEILGQPYRAFFLPEDIAAGKPDRLLAEAATLGYAHDEGWRVRKDGSRCWVEASLTAMYDASGKLAGFAKISHDLTERQRTNQAMARQAAELRRAEEVARLKDHFLSTISHEMKTPLALITGYAELLEDLGPTPMIVEGIQDGARRLTEHIEQILDYSAMLGGTLPLYDGEVNFEELAGNLGAIVAERFEHKELDLAIEVDPHTPCIQGDARRLAQVFLALMENAEKFTPAGGQVGLRIGPEGRHVRIDVWDTGPGIPEVEFGRVWDAFHQVALDDAARTGGLGLGLAIVRKLVELHGGRVALVSRLGHGSTFSVFLPVHRGCVGLSSWRPAPGSAR